MTPELLASWKRIVSGYREVPEYYEDSQAILAVDAELEALRQENAELNHLFDLQRKRIAEATREWREATGRHDVLPDLGKLIQWLREQREEALAQVARLEEERDDFESGYKSQARRNCALHDEIKELRAQVARLVDALVTTICDNQKFCHACTACSEPEQPLVHASDCPLSDPTAQSAREWLEARIAEAVRAERERCAKIAESQETLYSSNARDIAAAIRGRAADA